MLHLLRCCSVREWRWSGFAAASIGNDGLMQSGAVGAAEVPAIPRRAWYALLLTSFGQFFVIFDSSVLNVAFPSIERDFTNVARTTLAWTLTSYSIGTASLLLLAGRIADLFGRKKVFLTGISVFALGSLASGLAPSVGFLIAARSVQSIGGALMIPTSIALATVRTESRGEYRPVSR